MTRCPVATLERHRMQGALVSLSQAFAYYAEIGEVALAVAVAESYPIPPLAPLGAVTLLIAQTMALGNALFAPDSFCNFSTARPRIFFRS